MSAVRIHPGPANGSLAAPPSKSYTHRALVVAHLAGARFHIERPLDSDDTRRTAQAVAALGTPVEFGPKRWTVTAGGPRGDRPVQINCGESGTTLRFAAALAARQPRGVRFTGRERLGRRPMESLLRALRTLGATTHAGASGFPLDVRGPIHGGHVQLSASESSQFVSSLILTLPTLPENSQIELVGPVVSAPYIDATVAVLDEQGIQVRRHGRRFSLAGGQRVERRLFRVPGDASSAAYLWTAAAVGGGRVRVSGVDRAWPEADRSVLQLLERAGADVDEGPRSVSVAHRTLRPFSVDLTKSPDLYPLAGVLASVIPGTSRLRGAPHVVHKESNRRAGTARLARALGAEVREGRDGLTIRGTRSPRPVALLDLTDHRMLMSAAVGALAATGPSRLGPAAAVEKSFPGFWTSFRALGVEVGQG